MTKAMDCLYGLAAKTVDDELRALDQMKAPRLRRDEAKVRADMDAWVRDCVAAIAHTLTDHGGRAAPL